MTSNELKALHVSRAEFGRVVGLSAMRITQLAQAGLIAVDDHGVRLLESLKNFFAFRGAKFYFGADVDSFVQELTRRRHEL